MASFNTVASAVLEIWVFKVRKTGYFFRTISTFMKFQKAGTKALIFEFSNLVVK